MNLEIANWEQLDTRARRTLLQRPAVADAGSLPGRVSEIIEKVQDGGDAALLELTARYDGVELDSLRVSAEEIEAAAAQLSDHEIKAIDLAIQNVRCFHEAQLPAPVAVETMPGVLCERIAQPLDTVGLYVPAGSAPLPSAAIMLGVPAEIAGCPGRIMCTPPGADGRADAAVLLAASKTGIRDIFKVGGAQAIAAMAYGTESIPSSVKVFGPGNAWVTAAKAQVSQDPLGAAIDMPAGPSEVLVIADEFADPGFVAADLLSQAEHGPDSQVLLLTPDETLARAVATALTEQLADLPRRDIAAQALSKSSLIVVRSLADAVLISNDYAPEHLILQCRDARELVPALRNAASVFLGPWTPESVGDYCSGTNHVLPTYGNARSYSGLGVDQFLRFMTVQELSRDGLLALGEATTTLARLEGLDAHAAAVTRRLEAPL